MNSRECNILQKLVSELDDTRALYTKLGPLLTGPRPIYLAGLIILLHEEIAEDLAREMNILGSQTPHRAGSALGKLRAYLEPLLAATWPDVDLGCLRTIIRHETRVVQRYVRTLDDVAGLSGNLYREQLRLGRALFRIESLIQEMAAPALTFARNARIVARIGSTPRRRL